MSELKNVLADKFKTIMSDIIDGNASSVDENTESYNTAVNEVFETVEADKAKVASELAEVNTNLEAANAKIAELEASNEELTKSAADAQEMAENTANETTTKVAELNEKITELEATNAELIAVEAPVETTNKTKEAVLTGTETPLQSMNRRISDLN